MLHKLGKLKKLLDIDDNYIGLQGLTDRTNIDDDGFTIKNNDNMEFRKKDNRKKLKPLKKFTVKVFDNIKDKIDAPNEFLPSIPFAIYINGVVSAGKSTIMRSLLDVYINSFDKVVFISPNLDLDPNAIMLLDTYPNIEGYKSLEVLRDIEKKLKQHNKGKLNIKDKFLVLVIMDDLINDLMELGNKRTKNFLNEIAISRRHIGISYIMLSQYFKRIHPIFRTNFNSYVLFRQENELERKKIVQELSGFLGEKKFSEAFDEATTNPHDALTINFTTSDKRFQYTKNFNEVLIENPDELDRFDIK